MTNHKDIEQALSNIEDHSYMFNDPVEERCSSGHKRRKSKRSTGHRRTGPKKTGPKRRGPGKSGHKCTGPRKTGPKHTGPRRSGHKKHKKC